MLWQASIKPVLTDDLFLRVPEHFAGLTVDQGHCTYSVNGYKHHTGDIEVFLSTIPFHSKLLLRLLALGDIGEQPFVV